MCYIVAHNLDESVLSKRKSIPAFKSNDRLFFFYGEVEILQGTEDIMNMVYSTLLSMFNTFSACCSGKLLKFPHMQVLIGHSDV